MPANPFDFSTLPRPCLMGIVNVTPDSFSDGGACFDPAAAIAHARHLAHAGAALLDLGAEASSFFRKGIEPTAPDEQLRRLENVIPSLLQNPALPLSIDTRSAAVAHATLSAGARIINDISAGTHDPAILATVAHHNAGLILMHMGPTFPSAPTADDPDILATVRTALQQRITAALHAGIPRHSLALDPGLGFGKTLRDNWTLALRCHELASLGLPLLLAASRKRFVDTPPPADIHPEWITLCHAVSQLPTPPLHPRDIPTAALTVLTNRRGIQLHRVHNVSLTHHALTL